MHAKNFKGSLTAREKDAIKIAIGVIQTKIRRRKVVV
jgi:hypothetical protein